MERRTYRRTNQDGTLEHESDRTAYVVHDDGTPGFNDPAYAASVAEERTVTRYTDSLTGRVNAVLFTLVAALEGLLAIRFALVAFGANPRSGFVDFILDVSHPFVRPFENAFANRTWDEGIIEVNTLLAMGVYLLGAMLVAALLNAMMPRIQRDAGTTVQSQRISHT